MAGGPKFNRQAERHCLPFVGFGCSPLPGLPTCSTRPSRISWKAPHTDSYTYSSPTLFELISFSLSTTKFSTAELEYLCDPKLPLVCLCFPKACRRVPQTSTEGTFTARGPVNLVQELGQVTVTGPSPIPFTRPVLPPETSWAEPSLSPRLLLKETSPGHSGKTSTHQTHPLSLLYLFCVEWGTCCVSYLSCLWSTFPTTMSGPGQEFLSA